jgi:beta-galactosidase
MNMTRSSIGFVGALLITVVPLRAQAVSSIPKTSATAPAADRQIPRSQRRANYRPIALPEMAQARCEISLTGNWLFAPSTEPAAASGAAANLPDDMWHVLAVPQFWNEIEWWIYYKNRGTSHNFTQLERARCESFTFDYQKTSAGWYQQWIDVPKSYAGKRISVQFDAAASAAEVFWNGQRIGAHVGMFSPFECEATAQVRPGERNLLCVFVGAGGHDPKGSKEVAAVAVTMTVTRDMLQSMPHSTYPATMGGIWQPVKLVVTGAKRLDDVYFHSAQDHASVETRLSGGNSSDLLVRHMLLETNPLETPHAPPLRLRDQLGREQWQAKAQLDQLNPNKEISLASKVEISGIQPRLWSPEHPNLYWLKTELIEGDGD